MSALPSNVNYGQVVGQFLEAWGDGAVTPGDPDVYPDGKACTGTIRFTAVPTYIVDTTATPNPVTIFPKMVTCKLDTSGYLLDPDGNQGVYLVADDDPDLNPTGWTWSAAFNLDGIAQFSRNLSVGVGQTVDLANILGNSVPPDGGTAIVAVPSAVTSVVGRTGAITGAQIAGDAALVAKYAGLWQSQTPYTAGQIVRDQFGYMLIASAGFTSALTYSAIEAANWKDVSGKVSPKRFGAAGNGTTDDTAAIQAALNTAVSFGAALSIDARYKTTAALSLPINSTGAVTILAATADSNPFGSTSLDKASIESTGSAVFSQAASGVVVLNMRDVNFRNLGASTATLFTGVTLNTSSIVGCAATKYGYILDSTSGAWQVTRFTGNRFENVGTSWCAGDLVDSFLSNNYFNGDPTKNASFLTGTASTTVITDNYFDFFKRVFDYSFNQYNNNKYDVRVEGNIFDYCWNTLGSSANEPMRTYKFVGNSWIHCTAAAALSFFPNADSDMTGTPWSAISSTNSLTDTNVIGNHFMSVDVAMKITGTLGRFRESGNIYGSTGMLQITPSSFTSPADILIQALDETDYAPTFAAAQTIDWSQGSIQQVTLTANMTSLTFTNMIPGRSYELWFIQDGTGGRTLAGVNSHIKFQGTTPTLSTAAGASDVFRFRADSTAANAQEINRGLGTVLSPLLITSQTLTAAQKAQVFENFGGLQPTIITSNGTYTVPGVSTETRTLRITAVAAGGGGTGGGTALTSGGVSTQVGGPGGGAGESVTNIVQVAAGTVLTAILGVGGTAGAGGAANGNAGTTGGLGGNTTVTGTGVNVLARGGSNGAASGANSTSQANAGWGGTGVGAGSGGTAGIGGYMLVGGVSANNAGYPPGPAGHFGQVGGGGGGPANATNGGNAGIVGPPGGYTFTNGHTGTANGQNATNAPANSGCGGPGGGGGAPGGTGGNGGVGGSGVVVIEVIA